MSSLILPPADPERDLVLERVIPITPQQAYDAWTRPELITQWFTPAPWKTIEAEVDQRAGGVFKSVMQSPEGQVFPNVGCVLEAVPPHRLTWTGALQPGFRPHSNEAVNQFPFIFTCILTFEPHDGGTKYRALAIHPDKAACEKHSAMGFHVGWGMALDQMIAMYQRG